MSTIRRFSPNLQSHSFLKLIKKNEGFLKLPSSLKPGYPNTQHFNFESNHRIISWRKPPLLWDTSSNFIRFGLNSVISTLHLVDRPQSNHLRQFFNLRPGESSLVRQLFFHNFFQGVGIAFFFTAANTLFLEFFSVKWLPWIYLASALLLFAFGRAYAYFEHHWPLKKLMTFVVATLVLAPLLFYSGLAAWQQAGLIFLLMAFHRVLYALNSLEFWGLSALAFNVRQSKRIFPLIGAGDIPAKLLGYLAVTAIVPFTGIEALLLIASCSFLVSYFFVHQLAKHHRSVFQHSDQNPDFSPGFQSNSNWLPTSLFRSPFILWLSLLSVVSLIALTLLDYAFLIEVKYSFKKKEDLARFFGLLFSLGYTLILISKFLISGRMIDRLGVVRATFILPIFLCISSLAALSIGIFTSDPTIMLWIYSAILIGVEMIKYSIDDPNLMTLFQPLSKSLRLHGHTLVKTIMNPLGLLFAGALLLLILHLSGAIDLTLISAILLLFSVLMTLLSFKVRAHYLRQLYHAVRTRYFEGSEFSIHSPKTLKILEEKLLQGSEGEAIHSLKILAQHPPAHWHKLLSAALKHPGEQVRTFAIQLFTRENPTLPPNQLLEIIRSEQSQQVLQAAITALPTVAPDKIDILYNLSEASNPDIRAAAITALLSSQQLEAETKAGNILLDLIHSDRPEDLILACQLLQRVEKKNNYSFILPLLHSNNPSVQSAAIDAAENIRHPQLQAELFRMFDQHAFHSKLLKSLAAYKNMNLQPVHSRLSNDNLNYDRDRHLCTLLANIKTPESLDLLFQQLTHPISELRGFAIRLLFRVQFTLQDHHHTQLRTYCDQLLNDAAQFLFSETQYDDLLPLTTAFLQERESKIQELLMMLSFKYDRLKLNRIMDSLSAGHPDQLAAALEMLEYEVPKSIFRPLESFLDPTSNNNRSQQITKNRSNLQSKADIKKDILQNHWKKYSRWTTAIFLHQINKTEESFPELLSLANHPSILIREQATSILNSSQKSKAMHSKSQTEQSLLQIEKILLLKNTRLFQNIPEHILVDLADIVLEMECASGEKLFNKGELGTKMFIIANGAIRIHDEDHTFSVLQKHQIFGELALLSPEPRSASATAAEDTLLLCIDQAPFFELISSHPEVTKGIIQRLAELLRKQNEEIVEMKKQIPTKKN